MLLGIDVGGTAIKIGALAENGDILGRHRLKFVKGMAFDDLVDKILKTCRKLEDEAGHRSSVLGVCMPGFIDRASGLIIDGGNNVPVLKTSSLPMRLSQLLDIPFRVENDGVAATMGELHFGAGRGLKRFMLLTIGTGIGGAIAIEGSVVTGSKGEPPELGAMVLQPSHAAGPGQPGTLEHLTCAAAFLRAYKARSGDGPVRDLFDLFQQVDAEPAAREAVEEISCYIAQALGTMINALNLEACVIGGGVAGAGDKLLSPIRKHLADFAWPYLVRNVKIVPAERGNDAGILGAAWTASQALEKSLLHTTQSAG